MRKTKAMKIISVILAAILVIGSIVAVSVSASDPAPADRVEITAKGLDFAEETKLVYTLGINEELLENERLYLLFWSAHPDEEGVKTAEELYKSALHRAVPYVSGEALLADSMGIKAGDITSKVYSCPVIKTAADDGTYTYATAGAISESGVADVASELLQSASLSAAEKALYEATVKYGEMADKLFAGELNAPAADGDGGEPAPVSDALSVSIAFKNLSYKSAVKLVYYVDAKNVSDTQSVKLLVWDEKPASVTLDGATVKSAAGKIGEYDAFVSDGIAPAYMRDDIYCAAVVLDESGDIVAQSALLEYSVFDYCMDRIDKYPDEPKTAFYKALLDFGAAVQDYLMSKDEIEAVGGYLDAYYGVKFDSKLDGEPIVGAASEKVYLRAEDLASGLKVTADKYKLVSGATVRFNGFTDAEGNALTDGPAAYTLSTWNKLTVKPEAKIGFTQCYLNYTANGTLITYDDDSYKSLVSGTKDMTGTVAKDEAGNDILDENGDPVYASGIWGYVEDGVMKFGKRKHNSELTLTYTNKDLEGTVLVFETDIKFTAGTKEFRPGASVNDPWAFKMPYFEIDGKQYEMLLGYNEDAAGNGYFSAYHTSRFPAFPKLYLDNWYNVRIEIDTTKTTNNYSFYVNGRLIATQTLLTAQWNANLITGKPIANVKLNLRGYIYGVEMELDNTYVAMEDAR